MEKYTIRVFLFVVLCTIIVNGQTKTRQCKGKHKITQLSLNMFRRVIKRNQKNYITHLCEFAEYKLNFS